MGLRFDPMGGGQFKQAVQQIIEAESQPVKALTARKAKEDSRMKLFQEFKSKFSGLEKAVNEISSFKKFRELKADLGDGTGIVSVTLDKERAEPGQYLMEVDELAARTSFISNGFEDPNDPVLGVGFISMSLANGDNTEIYVDDSSSSLRGIASLINMNSSSPIRAAVIKDSTESDYPWKLLLTSKKDGAQNQLDSPDFYFLDASTEFYVDDDKEAQNALVVLDGFLIELDSNDESDFLPGVNLHLKQARPDQPFTLTITEDYQKVAGKVKVVVEQLNQILQFIIKQNSIDEHSDTTTTFAGDSSLQSIEYKLRNLIHQGFGVGDPDSNNFTVLYLTQLGIEFDKTGQVNFKEDKFNKALEKDFDTIAEAISGPMGLGNQLKNIFDSYTRTGTGFLSVKEQAIRTRIKDIDGRIDEKNRQLDIRKQQIVAQFSRLEATLGNLQRQQQYLSASLPGAGGGNPISQLLGG